MSKFKFLQLALGWFVFTEYLPINVPMELV
jgi:hypothetical protein